MKKIILYCGLGLSMLSASNDLNDFLLLENNMDIVYSDKELINPNNNIGFSSNKIGGKIKLLTNKYKNLSRTDILEFIELNIFGLISFKIKKDIVYKDYMKTGKKNIETKKEVEEILNSFFKNKKKIIDNILNQPYEEVFISQLKNKNELLKNFNKDLQSDTIKIIKNKIKEEMDYVY